MAQNNGKQRSILVVDDSSTDREIFKMMLKNEGYDVEVSASAKEAYLTLYEKEFDLIMCDYLMPDVDGEEFLINLRKDPKLKHYCIIMITSDESKETKVRLLQAGASDFVHKGCSYEEMVARIGVHLRVQQSVSDQVESLAENNKSCKNLNDQLVVFLDVINGVSDGINQLRDDKEKNQLSKDIARAKLSLEGIIALAKKI